MFHLISVLQKVKGSSQYAWMQSRKLFTLSGPPVLGCLLASFKYNEVSGLRISHIIKGHQGFHHILFILWSLNKMLKHIQIGILFCNHYIVFPET